MVPPPMYPTSACFVSQSLILFWACYVLLISVVCFILVLAKNSGSYFFLGGVYVKQVIRGCFVLTYGPYDLESKIINQESSDKK